MEDEAIINGSNVEDRTAENFYDVDDIVKVSDLNETEVNRLQHVSAISDGDKANTELRDLKKVLAEKESSLEIIDRENEKVKQEVENTMKAKAISERKVGELEKRIEGLLEKESEMKREKIRVEEEAKTKLNEKEREIRVLKKRIDDLEVVVGKNLLELEKEKKEKKEIEVSKNGVEVSLKVSEEKVKEMGSKIIQLQMEFEEHVIDKANKTGLHDALKGLKNSPWPAVSVTATGTMIVAGAAVWYLHHGKRR